MAEVASDVPRQAAISTCTSLTVMVLEFAWLFPDEIRSVWPKVRYRNKYALVYIAVRYLGMGSQIFNVYFSLRIASGVVTPPELCRLWFRYQAVTIQSLLAAVEISLMHRVYGLFLKNCWILTLLILLGIAQLLSMVLSARLALPNLVHSSTCYVTKLHSGTLFFGATTATTFLAILFMISWRYLQIPVPEPSDVLRYEPVLAVLRVIFRDSVLAILGILVLSLAMALTNSGVVQSSFNGNIIYHWLFCVLWFGRMTVNHEKVQVEAKKAAANDPRRQLTTIDLSETTSTWSTASETSTSHSDSTSPPYPRPLPPSYIPSRSPYIIDLSSHIEEISFNILGVHLSELSPQSSTEERSLPRRMSKTSDYSTRSEEVEMKVIDKQQVEDEKNRSQSEDGEDKDDKKRVSLVPPESPETPEDSCPSP